MLQFLQLTPPKLEQSISLELCHLLVRNWESQLDRGSLNLTDFKKIVLPYENEILRDNSIQRPIITGERVSKEVLQSLSDLLGHEIQLAEVS